MLCGRVWSRTLLLLDRLIERYMIPDFRFFWVVHVVAIVRGYGPGVDGHTMAVGSGTGLERRPAFLLHWRRSGNNHGREGATGAVAMPATSIMNPSASINFSSSCRLPTSCSEIGASVYVSGLTVFLVSYESSCNSKRYTTNDTV